MDTRVRGESRRSTRVALKIVISVQGLSEPPACDGETIVVNRHEALISSSVPLRIELKIKIQVVLTGKCVLTRRLFMLIPSNLRSAESL